MQYGDTAGGSIRFEEGERLPPGINVKEYITNPDGTEEELSEEQPTFSRSVSSGRRHRSERDSEEGNSEDEDDDD